MKEKKMDPGFARWLLANDGKRVTIHTHELVEDYDDETGNVPGVTRTTWNDTMFVGPDVLAEARRVVEEDDAAE